MFDTQRLPAPFLLLERSLNYDCSNSTLQCWEELSLPASPAPLLLPPSASHLCLSQHPLPSGRSPSCCTGSRCPLRKQMTPTPTPPPNHGCRL